MTRTIQICISVDVDAVAGWLGSYGGEDSPCDISRGCFAAEVGAPRLLKLFAKHDITTSWYIPGHSLESFPTEMAMIRDAGHEIGLPSVEQQRAVLDKSYKLLSAFVGDRQRITGNVTPWWECSREGVELLLEYGIEYDHSAMAHDCQCYYLRDEDKWTKIDYSKDAETWMKPLIRGKETGLVEIPASWILDEMIPCQWMKSSASSHRYVEVRTIETMWKDHFDYCYREEQDFVMPITIHPDTSGKPGMLLMLDRFIQYLKSHRDVQFVTMQKINETFRAKHGPPSEGAKMPAGMRMS